MGGVKTVETAEDFKKELADAGDKLVVVDFFATWCGPCKMIAPKLKEMSEKEYADSVIFLSVDVDDCEEVAESQGVSAMPTFKFFKKGEVVAEVVGASEPKIREAIEKNK